MSAHLPTTAAPGTRTGLAFAVASATSFGLAGPLARGLLDAGWSPGAVVLARIGIAALAVAPFTVAVLRGRWGLLRQNVRLVLFYGAVPIALAQFGYFSAVAQMDVGPALLIEYTAPAAVVAWLWLRRGERPTVLTAVGAGVAALGLVLVLDLVSGANLALGGVLWALMAMVGATAYFLLSADTETGLPPLGLGGCGLAVAALGLALLGAVGILPMRATTLSPEYAGTAVAWWVPLLLLGVVTAGVAYCAGIVAARLLGSRLASFVALLEVLAGIGFALVLLDQLPGTFQLVGGALVLAGVVIVKLGEADLPVDPAPQPAELAGATHG